MEENIEQKNLQEILENKIESENQILTNDNSNDNSNAENKTELNLDSNISENKSECISEIDSNIEPNADSISLKFTPNATQIATITYKPGEDLSNNQITNEVTNQISNNESNSIVTQPINISSTYDTLVISGASAKGIIFLGGLQYLYDNFLLQHIKTFIGTSVGSILCYLLIIGYTPIEIMVYISTHQIFEKMQNFDILSLVKGHGAFSFSFIQEELEKMTIEKIGYLPTLKSIKEKYNKNFISVTYNLSENKTEYLSYENYPDLPCISAIRMTSNLPFVFDNYKYGNSFYIDGGISNNFPIDIAQKYGNKILGLALSSNKNKSSNNTPISSNILELFYKLIFIPVSQYIELREQTINIEKTKIIKLNYSGDLKVFNFNISSKDRLEMFSNGYQQIKDILENKHT